MSIVLMVLLGWFGVFGIIACFWLAWARFTGWKVSIRKWVKYGLYELVAFALLLVPALLIVGGFMFAYSAPASSYVLIPIGLLLIVSRFARWGVLFVTLCLPYVFWDPAYAAIALVLTTIIRCPAYVVVALFLRRARHGRSSEFVWVLNK